MKGIYIYMGLVWYVAAYMNSFANEGYLHLHVDYKSMTISACVCIDIGPLATFFLHQ